MRWLAGAVVGVVLLTAGAAKLASDQWPEQARVLGAPAWMVPLVPWLELALGALLVAGVGTPWVAIAAVALLVAFTVLIAANLARGRRPPCACFGRLWVRPIGPWTVIRNVVLVGAALASATA